MNKSRAILHLQMIAGIAISLATFASCATKETNDTRQQSSSSVPPASVGTNNTSNPLQGGIDAKGVAAELTKAANAGFQEVFNLARQSKSAAPAQVSTLVNAMQSDATDQRVISNMCALENAVVDYASQHGGQFPPVINNFMHENLAKQFNSNSFFFKRYVPDEGIVNPCTSVAEWPRLGSTDDVARARAGNPGDIPAGCLEYCYGGADNSYVIMGGGHDGKALRDSLSPNKALMRSSGQ